MKMAKMSISKSMNNSKELRMTSSLTLTRRKKKKKFASKTRRLVASPRSCRTWIVSVRLLNSRSLRPISKVRRRMWPWKTAAVMMRRLLVT